MVFLLQAHLCYTRCRPKFFSLSLSSEDFICPPRLDQIMNVTAIEVSPGESANLVCLWPLPPITHYEWTFSPKLSAKYFGAELWHIRFIQQTSLKHIEFENVYLEGNFECRAVSPNGTLSVNISVSSPQALTALPSDSSKMHILLQPIRWNRPRRKL